jgi:hypothetical protein
VPENTFDERIAATYEAKWPELFEPAVVDPAVSFLAGLARSGTALELGIGTGRLALPLSQRCIRVHGIERQTRDLLGAIPATRRPSAAVSRNPRAARLMPVSRPRFSRIIF